MFTIKDNLAALLFVLAGDLVAQLVIILIPNDAKAGFSE